MSGVSFKDRGKTRLAVPRRVAEQIERTVVRATAALFQEGERRRKDRTGARRTWTKPRDHPLKHLVFTVLPEAFDKATGSGVLPTSVRSLFYQVRPLLEKLTHKVLDYTYFSQTLLTEYRDRGHELPGLYYDSRGVLYEPHEPPESERPPYSGRTMPIGTRAVEDYHVPPLLYNKILYVEKRGIMPVLAKAQLGNRHDMAIIAGEGYATEAIRTLLERAERHCQLFVLHDADADGYNIARTLCEETARMPWYDVDVVDLGLTVGDGLAMGLEAETFTQDKNLPQDLLDKLGKDERAFLQGQRTGRKTWTRRRIELNAMTGPQLIGYIKRRLAEEGAASKVIPDDKDMPGLAEAAFQQQVAEAVGAIVRHMLSLDEIQKQVAEAMHAHVDLSLARHMIEEGLAEDDTQSWHAALSKALRDGLDEHADILTDEVRRRIQGVLLHT